MGDEVAWPWENPSGLTPEQQDMLDRVSADYDIAIRRCDEDYARKLQELEAAHQYQIDKLLSEKARYMARARQRLLEGSGS